MKELWINLEEAPKEKLNEILSLCINLCDVVFLPKELINEARKIGVKKIASTSNEGDIKIVDVSLKKDLEKIKEGEAVRIFIKSGEDEDLAISAIEAGARYVIVNCVDWKIIPLENLIAKIQQYKGKLIAEVSNIEEVKTALKILELGVDGILIKTFETSKIEEANKIIKKIEDTIELKTAKITSLKPLELGARVCVDTCDIMKEGEGILVGSQSSGLFLVQAEVQVNPYVEPRPFRVNAGAISSYVLAPGNKTRYLSELKAGDEILVVNREGKTRKTNVCRVKIEYRPLILVEAEYNNETFKVVLQNAETIRLVTKNSSKSIAELKPGDEVLIRFEKGGRHFGTLVKEETVIEK
ncbi:MAG: 3-dehydroquinate synthase II [Candidatus Bathyarchaeia archaeon]|nr:3-dehydroquinate synthase II [Candidatus Bathyarchaeota archaeon]